MKKNIGIISIIVAGLALISVVSFVIMKSNQTVKVWVPAHSMKTGDIITDDNLKQIEIPVKTPGDYLNNKEVILGNRLKNNVEENQLFYKSSFLASWEIGSEDEDIHEDFIITSMFIPDERALGGLIVAGDTVDVLGVSKGRKFPEFDETNAMVGAEDREERDDTTSYTYYILSNVKIINTNSRLSEVQDNDLSEVVETGSGDGSFYLVALSYDDAKKLRQAEGALELWLNMTPKQNEDNPPLIAQMVGQSIGGLHDSRYPIQDKDGSILEGAPVIDSDKINDEKDKQKDEDEEDKEKDKEKDKEEDKEEDKDKDE